ncbi:MAG: hypothetical protein U1E23_18175 [Reyranellaceae bacterium]
MAWWTRFFSREPLDRRSEPPSESQPDSQNDILAAAESLSDAERWRSFPRLGERAATDPAARAGLDALAARPEYFARRLALLASHGSGDRDVILPALTGPSSVLASLAIKPAVRFVDDETLAAALTRLPGARVHATRN